MIMRVGRAGRGKDDPGRKPDYIWERGKLITVKRRGRGKDMGGTFQRYESDINPNFKPKTATKTGAGVYQERELPASGNILEMPKALTFEESLAQGSRADDPRNWEFYYDESKVGYATGKDLDPREKKAQARRNARRRAQREADLAGQDVYDTLKAEYEAAMIRDQMKFDRLQAARKGGPGQFGSTRTARNVAMQKIVAGRTGVTRQAGRAQDIAGVDVVGGGPTRRQAAMQGTTTARAARRGRRQETT